MSGQQFGSAAEAYTRLRPPPSAAVLRWGLSGSEVDVLDLAAGTGQVSLAMLDPASLVFRAPPRVTAVEPDARMRETLSARLGQVSVLDGTAESIPVSDASHDAVVVGSAWHWFDEPAALREIARVLRPGGRLCVVATSPDITVDWVRKLYSVAGLERIDRHARCYERSHRSTPGFDGLTQAKFHTAQTLTRDDIVSSFETHSIYLESNERQRRAMLDQVTRTLAASFPGAAVVDFPFWTLGWSMTWTGDSSG